MSANANTSRDVIELWGREFNIVKSGLSEAQVVSFVNDLAKQHDLLLQRQEHLNALTKLAERTVSEADKLAEEMREEAKGQVEKERTKVLAEAESKAKADAARIVEDAQAKSEAKIKEKESKAAAAAAEHASRVKEEAEKLAADMKAEAEKLSNDVMAEAEEKARRVVSDAEARGKHIIEQKEAEAAKVAQDRAKEILQKAERDASTLLEREKKRIQPELNQFVQTLRGQLIANLDSLKHQVGALEAGLANSLARVPANGPGNSGGRGRNRDEFMDLVGDSGNEESGEPEWDVEVVPPIDIMKIMNIVGYIDGLPEVSRTEIIPRNDRTSITVYLNEPVDMLDLIKALPEVAHADELKPSGENGKLKKISVALSLKNEVAESL
jgi:vacuolar-type H+-ATPase subunit H